MAFKRGKEIIFSYIFLLYYFLDSSVGSKSYGRLIRIMNKKGKAPWSTPSLKVYAARFYKWNVGYGAKRHCFEKDRRSGFCGMLVVRRCWAVSHAFIHQVSNVADRTPILEKESDHRYLVAMTTREKVASRATGKRTTQWCRYFSFWRTQRRGEKGSGKMGVEKRSA